MDLPTLMRMFFPAVLMIFSASPSWAPMPGIRNNLSSPALALAVVMSASVTWPVAPTTHPSAPYFFTSSAMARYMGLAAIVASFWYLMASGFDVRVRAIMPICGLYLWATLTMVWRFPRSGLKVRAS